MTTTRSTKTWLGCVVAIQAFTVLAMWGGGPAAQPAQAQGIPDSGAQLLQIIEQLKATNAKMDRLITMLGEGKVEVTLRKSEDAGRNR